MPNRIVVPLDGSAVAEQALPPALDLARRIDAELVLVAVQPMLLPPTRVSGTRVHDTRLEVELRAELANYIEQTAQRVQTEGARPVTARLLEGPIADTLAAYLDEDPPRLVVMTTHGRGGISRLWLGSVTERLVRRSPVPVLVLRAAETVADAASVQPGRVLIPLDGSEQGERILPIALPLFVERGATRITLLRAVAPEYHAADEVPPAQREAGAYLLGVAERLTAQGSEVQTRVVEHVSAAGAILEAAASGADLVAMTTHGYGGVKLLLLGSVADKVLRASPVPVLLVGGSVDTAR